MNIITIAPLVVPLLGAAILLLLPRRRILQGGVSAVIHLMHCGAAIALFRQVQADGIILSQMGSWAQPFGIGILADKFSALMIGITALIGLTTGIYSLGSVTGDLVLKRYYPLLQLLLAGVSGAFLAGDLFNLFVWFEVLLMASFVLLTIGGTGSQIEAGVKYLVINFVASLLFLSAAGLAFAEFGTLSMIGLGKGLTGADPSTASLFIGGLLLVAFGLKAGVFPVYSWLPASYHTPPPAITAVFAGLLTKVGVYALYRTGTLIFPSYGYIIAPLMIVVGCCTMLTGVLGAVAQMHVKKILSFHIISQIGYMILALGLWSTAAVAAGIFYVLHHIIVKANLFFLAGIARSLTGSYRLSEMGGLYKHHPYISLLFLIPAMSLSGVPPLSGFFAKFTLLNAAFQQGQLIAAGIALAVGLLTLFSMTKIWNETFWKARPVETTVEGRDNIPLMAAAVIILAVGTLLIGIFPGVLWNLSMAAAEQMFNPSLYEAVAQRSSR